MAKEKKNLDVVMMIFANDYHHSVQFLHRTPSNNEMLGIVAKALEAFRFEPADKRVIIRFWDIRKNEGLLSFEWSWPKNSSILLSGCENEDSMAKDYQKVAWQIIDAVGFALTLSEAHRNPFDRNYEQELKASKPPLLRKIRRLLEHQV